MTELLCKEEVYTVVGAAMEVYNQLGPGFLEAVYQEAYEIELALRNIPFLSQPRIPIFYKGRRLEKYYESDLLAFNKVMIEIKAMNGLSSREEAQLLNQLKATEIEVGVLINFGAQRKLEWKRLIFSQKKNK